MDLSTYGLPVLLLAKLADVHIDTARRWKRAGTVPRRAGELIQLKLNGELCLISEQWNGFRIAKGKLWTPEDMAVTPGEVRAIPYRYAQLLELQRALAEPHQRTLF